MGLNDNWTEGGVTTATREKGHQQATFNQEKGAKGRLEKAENEEEGK